MEITRADIQDAEVILAIQKSAYLSEAKLNDDYNIPPLTQSLKEMKEDFNTCVFLKAILDNHIVGSVKAYVVDGVCYIGRLIVLDVYQNKGIGTALMQQIEKEFPAVQRYELFTGKKSRKNIYLYKKLGYKVFKEQMLNDKTTLVYLEKRCISQL